MRCRDIGAAPEFCRKSCGCKKLPEARRKRSDDITVVDSDDCYDHLASCTALIKNGGFDCKTTGGLEFCKKSCDPKCA